MKARKLFYNRLVNGSTRCERCGKKFLKNEKKYMPYPPSLRLMSVCKKCKESEMKQ
jgi:hypothetical protein